MTEQGKKESELDPRIRIRAPLRCDGIGRLDCAEDTVSGARLAVRWLPLEANGDAAVKACEKLPRHPTLPRIHQTGQVGASAFVALDFPDGELLSARGEERLDNEVLLKLAAQLSDALAIVHAQGVVHGEISRDSVLMIDGGKAVLWDMPLVIANRLSDRRGENRLMQNLVRTAPYLAPERARGDGASQSADVYALGALLCVAGGAPLPSAATTLGVVNQVARGEWSPRLPEGLPPAWSDVLQRMVASDPQARPSAKDVAMAFATVPGQNALPTVPELPAVRLPPEILAAADALMRSQVEAMRAPTREVPVQQVEALAATTTPEAEKPAGAEALTKVQAHTLDEALDATPEVVRIPTQELAALAVPPAVVEAKPVAASVPVTDALHVAPELAAASVTTTAAERQRAHERKLWLGLGAFAVAALVLVSVAVRLALRQPEIVVVPVPAAKKVAPPVAAPEEEEPLDELAAPAKLPNRRARKNTATPVSTTSRAAVPVAEPVEAAPEPVVAQEAPAPVEEAAPKSELKRPSVED